MMACFPPCRNEGFLEAVSPGNRWRAVAFLRTCGPLSHYRSSVSILPSDEERTDERGNLLDFQIPDSLKSLGGDTLLRSTRLRWNGDDQLFVEYDGRVAIILQTVIWNGITVHYNVRPPSSDSGTNPE